MKENELILGPRIPKELWEKERKRFLVPTIILVAAAVILFISIFFPYWKITLFAPQYPSGLQANMYVNRLAGDINEIDGLNHYIGMKPLGEAAGAGAHAQCIHNHRDCAAYRRGGVRTQSLRAFSVHPRRIVSGVFPGRLVFLDADFRYES